MAEKKEKIGMTTREFINGFLAGKTANDVLNGMTYGAKAEELLSAMDKRNESKKNSPKKPTKASVENAPIRQAIIDYLSTKGESVTAKEISENIGQTPAKTGAVLRSMEDVVAKVDFGRYKPFEYRIKG
jgi:hypothetical protein